LADVKGISSAEAGASLVSEDELVLLYTGEVAPHITELLCPALFFGQRTNLKKEDRFVTY